MNGVFAEVGFDGKSIFGWSTLFGSIIAVRDKTGFCITSVC